VLLTAAQTQKLQETEQRICQFEQIIAVTSGLGSSHSSQGLSASFSDTQIRMAISMLPILKNLRDKLIAMRDDMPLPSAPGVTISRYQPTSTFNSYGYGV
jgi:hypothetical protein